MGYYGTCDGLLWDEYAGYYDSVYNGFLWSVYDGLLWQSMVYDPYEYVPISYGAVTFFDSGRLLWRMMIFELNPLSFLS